MRRPPMHVCVLLVLVPLTLFIGFAVLKEGDGPYDGETTISFRRFIDRQKLGYTNESQYGSWQWDGRFFGYDIDDIPDPSSVAGNSPGASLPPLVLRQSIYWIDPAVLLIGIGAGWSIWLGLFIRNRQILGVTQRGFEVAVDP